MFNIRIKANDDQQYFPGIIEFLFKNTSIGKNNLIQRAENR